MQQYMRRKRTVIEEKEGLFPANLFRDDVAVNDYYKVELLKFHDVTVGDEFYDPVFNRKYVVVGCELSIKSPIRLEIQRIL